MKIREILYDSGTANFPEDNIVFQPPYFFGVVDGVSGVYCPELGPLFFDGLTGGQLAGDAIVRSFANACSEESLEGILERANTSLRDFGMLYSQLPFGLFLSETEMLPSASAVLVKVNDCFIEILSVGDCLATWVRNGVYQGTPNAAFFFERKLRSIIARLMEKHNGNKNRMWEEFIPILTRERRQNINTPTGFSLVNGQPESKRFWRKTTLPREEVEFMALFTDGFVPFEWTARPKELSENVHFFFRKWGLRGVLGETRRIVTEESNATHETFPEATAIAFCL